MPPKKEEKPAPKPILGRFSNNLKVGRASSVYDIYLCVYSLLCISHDYPISWENDENVSSEFGVRMDFALRWCAHMNAAAGLAWSMPTVPPTDSINHALYENDQCWI